jgi:hypothetical protein
MDDLKERCEEAIRQEILKDFKGKIVSQSGYDNCILNEKTGRYRVTDASVNIYEDIFSDEGGGFYYTNISIWIEAETLKGKKKRYFKYELM